MAAVRGGQAKPPPKPKVVIPKVPKGTNVTNNPWNLNIPGLQSNDGHGGIIGQPAPAAPPPAVAPPPAAPPGFDPATVDWAHALGLDPGRTSAYAAADEAIKNLNEQFNGASNPFSTVKQLDLNLSQNIRSNANAHAAHGTLFSGGTAQGASNANRDNQKSRYDATNALLGAIGQQQAAKAAADQAAVGNVMAHPEWYGINIPDPNATVAAAVDPGAPPPPPPTTAAAAVTQPFVTAAQLKKDPRAAQKKRNAL